MNLTDTSSPLLIEREGGIVTLTLNEPETRNALSERLSHKLINCINEINDDIDVRCVILTGAGKSFSSGGNVKRMRDNARDDGALEPAKVRRHLQGSIQRVVAAVYGLEVPIIAAVNGHAVGAGCDLTLMCDIRIASENAQFSEAFLRLGLISGDGGAWFLPRIVGLSKAYELTYTADMIGAEEAQRIGLVSRVVPHSELMSAARELAARIIDKPPHSVRLTKRLLRDSMLLSLPASMELAASMQAVAQSTEDHKEAATAFVEKRAPVFVGR